MTKEDIMAKKITYFMLKLKISQVFLNVFNYSEEAIILHFSNSVLFHSYISNLIHADACHVYEQVSYSIWFILNKNHKLRFIAFRT